MQNVDLGHTKVIQIHQRETLSHQGLIIHENCCSAAQYTYLHLLFHKNYFTLSNFNEEQKLDTNVGCYLGFKNSIETKK